MNVLFATSIKTWGGGEEWMLSQARGLAERGHAITLAARPGSAILVRAREVGIPLLPVAFRSDADLGSLLRVYRFCRRTRVDAICLNMDRVLRIAGVAAKLAGVRAILPRRGSEFPLKGGLLYRWTYQRVATGMIVNSRATAEALCRRIAWRPRGKLHVLLNGVQLSRFADPRPRRETRKSLDLSEDSLVVIVVGELTSRKNAALLLQAAPQLRRRFPTLRILLVGEGEEEERLRHQAAELAVASSVRFLGFRRDVPDLLAASDLLVHPARVEGFGYAVVEAMAAGLPVVATNASSLPEIVAPDVTGLLFPLDDREALERAVGVYLEDTERRARDGQAGRERARRRFSFERRLEELELILTQEVGAVARPERSDP
jgi:glycosyltransferase involved in cell wall biosynthesis